jgi:uncharacterized protein with PQ loop repeat
MKAFEIVEIFALICWSFQLAPQAWENYRRQSTIGLSPSMMLLWSLGSLCTAIYCIGADFGMLFIFQPNLFLVFSILSYAQCFYYDVSQRSGILYGALLTGFTLVCEVLGGYFLRVHMNDSSSSHDSNSTNYWPFTLLGVLSTICFGIGFVPQLYTIFRAGFVEGVSLPFLCIDMTGSVLSTISLLLQGRHEFQPISITCYVVVFVFDLTIAIMSFYLKPPPSASTTLGACDNKVEVMGLETYKEITVADDALLSPEGEV